MDQRERDQKLRAPGVVQGVFKIECIRDGKLVWDAEAHNAVTDAGLNNILDEFFGNATHYVGLISDAGYTSLANADTLASHAGWAETTAYAADRKEFVEGAAAAGSIDNSASPAEFTMNDTVTVKGAFLATVATGTAGVLYCTALFSAPGDRSVVSGDILRVTYTATVARAA